MKSLFTIMVSLIVSCQTTTKDPNTYAFNCVKENPHEENACEVNAVFVDFIDCVLYLNVKKHKKLGHYTMCSLPVPETK